MFWLSIKTLFHEKVRLVITLTGIIFSTVLTIAQVAVYLGMMGNATGVIRHIDADIWVMSKNVQNFDFANPFPEERINKLRALPEVLWADRMILTWGFLKLAGGGQEQVQIIGFNPDTGVGGPWAMASGSLQDVKGVRYMIIDRTSEKRLGGLEPGTIWELNQVQFKLAGLSEGTRSFTTAPVVFVAYNQIHRYLTSFVRDDQTTYIVAKLRDSSRTAETIKRLRAEMKDNDVFSKRDFIKKTVLYWTVQTGMGMGFFVTAILGLIVGGAIVGQTIYANTMEHLREYGTLKALGARNRDIYTVIFSQVGISAVTGFCAGSMLVLLAKNGIESVGVPLYLHPLLFLIMFFVVLFTCFLSAFFSVRKIRTLDPVTVFRA